MNNLEIIIGVAFLCIFILMPIIGAYILNKKHLERRQECKPYAWGYFQGLITFPATLLIFAGPSADLAIFIFFAVIYYPLAILTLLRNRWGFLILTILSLNPLMWIINGIYLVNRWNALSKDFNVEHVVAENP